MKWLNASWLPLPCALLPVVFPLALVACDGSGGDDFGPADDGADDDGSADDGGTCTSCSCQTAVTMAGEIDGAGMPSPDDLVDSVWFNQSLDEILLSELDEEAMDQIGLDSDDQADVERYRYLVTQADYRFLDAEDAGDFTRRKDITVFFFDLTGHPADLEHPVAIYDLSAVEAARESGDRDALGDAVRVAADAIRDNGQPDAVIAYAADRHDEGIGNILVSLLSPNARYASGGQAWIHQIQPLEGETITTIAPPLDPLFSISFRAQPVFPDTEDTMSLDVTCLAVTMSGR